MDARDFSFLVDGRNPYKQLLGERLDRQITGDEFQTALYGVVLKDKILLNGYGYKPLPIKPEKLQAEESLLDKKQLKKDPDLAGRIYKKIYEEFRNYFSARDQVLITNRSNKKFLEEMRDFFKKHNNLISLQAVNQVLFTHEEVDYLEPVEA